MVKEFSGTLPSRSVEFDFVEPYAVTIESVGALIYCNQTDRYLFLLRNNGKFANTWGIAGGKVDSGETVIQSLKREVREEIGITLHNEKLIPLETYTADNNYFVYHTYIVIVDNEFVPTLNIEHRGYAWTSISDIPRPLHPGLFRTLRLDEINNKINSVNDMLN